MEWLLISIIAVFGIVILVLGYACYNLLKKLDVHEEWVLHFRSEVNQMYDRLKAVDDRNLFDKDDDVGGTFSDILRICKEFNDRVQ